MGAQMRRVNMSRKQIHAQRAWGKIVRLVLKRYGIEDLGDDWTPWMGAVGSLRTQDLRGSLLVMSLHALGWSGLVAVYIVPDLKTLPYMGLCFFLIGFGLLNDNDVASRLAHPANSWLIGVCRAMDELKKVSTAKGEGKPASHDSFESTDPSNDLP